MSQTKQELKTELEELYVKFQYLSVNIQGKLKKDSDRVIYGKVMNNIFSNISILQELLK